MLPCVYLCSLICHKQEITGYVCVAVPQRRELGHRVGGSDLTRLVFSQETLGGRQRASILPGNDSYQTYFLLLLQFHYINCEKQVIVTSLKYTQSDTHTGEEQRLCGLLVLFIQLLVLREEDKETLLILKEVVHRRKDKRQE